MALGAASASTNVGQPLQKPITAAVWKGRSKFSLLYHKGVQAAPPQCVPSEKWLAFALNLSMCFALIPNPRDKKRDLDSEGRVFSPLHFPCRLPPFTWTLGQLTRWLTGSKSMKYHSLCMSGSLMRLSFSFKTLNLLVVEDCLLALTQLLL